MIRIWMMLTCLQTPALQQCPLVWITLGKNVFLHCEISTNLTQKISGHRLYRATMKRTLSLL